MTDPLGLDGVPAESGNHVLVPLMARCGAKKRSGEGAGEPCQNRAGFRTDHLGEGRCYIHGGDGGRVRAAVGRYAMIKSQSLRDLMEQYAADQSIFDPTPELVQARALTTDYINRYVEFRDALLAWHESYVSANTINPKPIQILDLTEAVRYLDVISKMIERIEKVRNANAVSRPDLIRMFHGLLLVLQQHEPSADIRERITRDWYEILKRV